MSRIYWDTMLFIYWFEANPAYRAKIDHMYVAMQHRGDTLLTGTLALGEILAGLHKAQSAHLIPALRQSLSDSGAHLLPFDVEAAERYGEIRAKHNVRPADAMHLATAAVAHTDIFFTNDRSLRNLVIPGIQFIAGLDSNIL